MPYCHFSLSQQPHALQNYVGTHYMKTVVSSIDLVTSLTERIKGFQWQAQQKGSLGSQFFLIADHFAKNASTVNSIAALWSDPKLRKFAVAASSLSVKSLDHITEIEQQKIVTGVIDFAKLKDESYIIELQRRYLLGRVLN